MELKEKKIQAIEGKIVANLILLSTEERNLESSYLYIAMRQFAMFGGLQLGREREVFSLIFFYNDQFSGNFRFHIIIEVSTCD